MVSHSTGALISILQFLPLEEQLKMQALSCKLYRVVVPWSLATASLPSVLRCDIPMLADVTNETEENYRSHYRILRSDLIYRWNGRSLSSLRNQFSLDAGATF